VNRANNIKRALGMVQNRFDTRIVRYPTGRFNIDLCQVCDPDRLAIELCTKAPGDNDQVPYWAQIWPVAFALARFISRKKLPPGLPVIELGCGTGLTGVAAALAGAKVTFTDYKEEALLLARVNHMLNLGSFGSTALLDWRKPARGASAQLIIAADALYDTDLALPLVNTIDSTLAVGGTLLLAHPGREAAELAVDLLEERGYRHTIHMEKIEHDEISQEAWVHVFHRSRKRMKSPKKLSGKSPQGGEATRGETTQGGTTP
jgi:predicted nicotinamide N-methyase